MIRVNDDSYNFKDYFQSDKHINLFIQAISCNTIGTIEEASATEAAMLKNLAKFGVDIIQKRKDHLPHDFVRFHFTSKRKRMSTILHNIGQSETNYDRRIHMKGAAEIVL